jgi:hypothetical protein
MQMPSITSSSGSSSNGSGGTQSVISGLTAPSVTPTPTRQRGAHVANLSQDTRLLQLVTPVIKIKDLMGMDPPPLLDNEQQLCLSFILCQGCWIPCRRAATHGHQLTTTEHARVTQYLTAQMQKLRNASAPSAATAPGAPQNP